MNRAVVLPRRNGQRYRRLPCDAVMQLNSAFCACSVEGDPTAPEGMEPEMDGPQAIGSRRLERRGGQPPTERVAVEVSRARSGPPRRPGGSSAIPSADRLRA